jgi:enamine deaminase RidA (YjgF/YER057c/UK114 family)
MATQTGQAVDNLEAVLKTAGYGLSEVVRLTSTRRACLTSSATTRGVTSLAFPDLLVEPEATAVAA